jgi:hypothetical protein
MTDIRGTGACIANFCIDTGSAPGVPELTERYPYGFIEINFVFLERDVFVSIFGSFFHKGFRDSTVY